MTHMEVFVRQRFFCAPRWMWIGKWGLSRVRREMSWYHVRCEVHSTEERVPHAVCSVRRWWGTRLWVFMRDGLFCGLTLEITLIFGGW